MHHGLAVATRLVMSQDHDRRRDALKTSQEPADDATVELSLREVFQFKRQDTRAFTLPEEPIDDLPPPGLATLSDEPRTLDDMSFEPDDIYADDEDPEGRDATSILSSEVVALARRDDSDVWPPTPQPRPHMATPQALADTTSIFEIPADLISQCQDDDDALDPDATSELLLSPSVRASIAASMQGPHAAVTAKMRAVETDTTRSISSAELALVPIQHAPDASLRRTMPAAGGEEELISFVGAIDEHMRLFIPRNLFEEGTLKPGMRLVIQAHIMK